MLDRIKERFGRIDVLVLNAACATHAGEQLAITEGAFDKMFSLNVKSTFFTIAESKDLLTASGKGSVVHVVSSVTGMFPNKMIGVYAMTKAALENMVKFLADELRDDKIRVTGIAPGLIRTDFADVILKNPDLDQRSVGEAHQIGSVVATMCSDDGSFINGETFIVSNGFKL